MISCCLFPKEIYLLRALYLFLVFIFLLRLDLSAQITTTIQTIEANDGYIYKGWLIDNIDGLIRFENIDGDTLEFYEEEIIQWINPDEYFIYKNDKFHQKKGPFAFVSGNFGGVADEFTLQFNYTLGKRIMPKLLIGAGTGFNFTGEFNQFVGQEFFGELYFYAKYYLTNTSIRPFLETKVGAFVGIEKRIRDDLYPGSILQGGVGVELAQRTHTRLSIRFNYLFMYALAKVTSQTNIFDDINVQRSLIGVSFDF